MALKIKEGATIDLLDSPVAGAQTLDTDAQIGLDKGYWPWPTAWYVECFNWGLILFQNKQKNVTLELELNLTEFEIVRALEKEHILEFSQTTKHPNLGWKINTHADVEITVFLLFNWSLKCNAGFLQCEKVFLVIPDILQCSINKAYLKFFNSSSTVTMQTFVLLLKGFVWSKGTKVGLWKQLTVEKTHPAAGRRKLKEILINGFRNCNVYWNRGDVQQADTGGGVYAILI